MRQQVKSFLKQHWFSLGILMLITLIAGVSFYWFGIRPAKIKSSCAWVEKHQNAVQAEPASPNYPDCKHLKVKTLEDLDKFLDCHDIITAQPAKDYKEQASNYEYEACLREHGL